MIQRVGARQARSNFADLLGRVGYGGEIVIVERSGKPLVAVMPIELFEQLMAEREERFRVIDRIRAQAPQVDEAEMQRDIDEAIRATQSSSVTSGT